VFVSKPELSKEYLIVIICGINGYVIIEMFRV